MIGPALLMAAATLVAPASTSNAATTGALSGPTAATPLSAMTVRPPQAVVARRAKTPPGPLRYERRVVRHTNRARRARGQVALRRTACLDLYAQRSADRIARTGRLTHQNLRPVLTRCGGGKVGENIAYGFDWPINVVRAWMNSPGHRANILERRYRRIGVGVRTGPDGTVWVSQVFAYRR